MFLNFQRRRICQIQGSSGRWTFYRYLRFLQYILVRDRNSLHRWCVGEWRRLLNLSQLAFDCLLILSMLLRNSHRLKLLDLREKRRERVLEVSRGPNYGANERDHFAEK